MGFITKKSSSMNLKEKIVSWLRDKEEMTQSELAEAIYGDKRHAPYIYSTLKSLVGSNRISRSGARPARYSLCEVPSSKRKENKETRRSDSKATKVSSPKAKQQTITMTAKRAKCLINRYYGKTRKDKHHRYLSWEHCYKAFSEKRSNADEQAIDHLALHLAFYLASWGMYRGSSFLLQKDYKVHIPVVNIILEEEYSALFGISAQDLCQDKNLSLLEEVRKRVKDCYEPDNVTDTLITKILLGTFGCVPAYDRYYVHSIKKHHVSKNGKYNLDSVRKIAKFYCDHFDVFEPLRRELGNAHGIDYPPMKLMDMCFWEDAYEELNPKQRSTHKGK